MSGDSAVESSDTSGVLDTAMRAAGVIWLSPDPSDPHSARADPRTTGPVWHVWSDGACYLLTGPGEQRLPGIVPGRRCQVTVRNSAGGRSLTWRAAVESVDPADPTWASVAPKLAAARLNGGDPVAMLPTWPGRMTVLALRPSGVPITPDSGMPEDSQAAPPLATPATTPYRMPSDITRRFRRRRRPGFSSKQAPP
ncbi:MAG: hypothetical protein M3400_16180 [Actinomycetota bacterium]|nr:hypothetical protein [Actinomycetota bacterium]